MNPRLKILLVAFVGLVITAHGLRVTHSVAATQKPAITPTSPSPFIEPQVVITWQAQNYTPSEYPGKTLPAGNSRVVASVSVMENGKVSNLSNQQVYWYLDDEFLRGGVGLQDISFRVDKLATESIGLRVKLPDYGPNLLVKTIEIPIAHPEIVVQSPFVGSEFSSSDFTLQATPYFFNISDPLFLKFSWDVNGQTPTSAENPNRLHITLPPGTPDGTPFTITATIEDTTDLFGVATKETTLTYRP